MLAFGYTLSGCSRSSESRGWRERGWKWPDEIRVGPLEVRFVMPESRDAQTYERRGYRPVLYIGLAFLLTSVVVWGAVAVLTDRAVVAIVLVAGLGVLLGLGARAQRRAPDRVTLSALGFRAESIFGTTQLAWSDVTGIEFRESRWKPGKVDEIRIESAGGFALSLVRGLSDYEELIARLRIARPDLIREARSLRTNGV